MDDRCGTCDGSHAGRPGRFTSGMETRTMEGVATSAVTGGESWQSFTLNDRFSPPSCVMFPARFRPVGGSTNTGRTKRDCLREEGFRLGIAFSLLGCHPFRSCRTGCGF